LQKARTGPASFIFPGIRSKFLCPARRTRVLVIRPLSHSLLFMQISWTSSSIPGRIGTGGRRCPGSAFPPGVPAPSVARLSFRKIPSPTRMAGLFCFSLRKLFLRLAVINGFRVYRLSQLFEIQVELAAMMVHMSNQLKQMFFGRRRRIKRTGEPFCLPFPSDKEAIAENRAAMP